MEIRLIETDKKNTLVVKGKYDTAAAAEIQPEIERICTFNSKDLDIDFSEVDFIASSGLRQILTLHKAAVAGKSKVTVVGAKENIKNVLKVTNFSKLIEIK